MTGGPPDLPRRVRGASAVGRNVDRETDREVRFAVGRAVGREVGPEVGRNVGRESGRAVGRAPVPGGGRWPVWSSDPATLAVLLTALRGWQPGAAGEGDEQHPQPAGHRPGNASSMFPPLPGAPGRAAGRGNPDRSAARHAAAGPGAGPPGPPIPPGPPERGPDGPGADGPVRFVLHLPVVAADLATARRLAGRLCRSLWHLVVVDAAEATVSYEDAQQQHHRVFCGRRLPGGWCTRSDSHPGACGQ